VEEHHFYDVRFVGAIFFAGIRGGVNQDNLTEIQQEFMGHVKNHDVEHVVFDFKELTGPDTTAVAGLLSLLNNMRQMHPSGKLGLLNVGEDSRNILEMSKLLEAFEQYASQAEAEKALLENSESNY